MGAWRKRRGRVRVLQPRCYRIERTDGQSHTSTRRPVVLVYHQEFDRITDAIAAERQVKGWTRAKKEALIRGDFASLRMLSRGRDRDGVDSVRPSTSLRVR